VIPVDQDRFGDPDGNCLQACLATLLDLDIGDVPHFTGEDWRARMGAWLRTRGLWALAFSPPAGTLEETARWLDETVPGYAIVSGQTPRGLLHATVWYAGELVHDPHPDRAGLLSVEDVLVLVPVDPAEVRR